MVKAMHFAPTSDGITVGPGLVGGEDITHQILKPVKPLGPQGRKSDNYFQKAALVSFQTWSIRTPGLVGVLFGLQTKNKMVIQSIVVDKSMSTLLSDGRLGFLCEQKGFAVMGVILAGLPTEPEDRQRMNQNLADAKVKFPQASVCVLAPRTHLRLACTAYTSAYLLYCKQTHIYLYIHI